jgi:purine catabolism regulator
VVGVSDESAAPGLRRAIQHALDAARFGSRAAADAGVHHFGDLGIFHLLLPLSEGPQLASYVEAELGPLLTHDSSAALPLLPTLQCFLEHSGRIGVTSCELHIQRRTLYHRLARLTGLLGRDLGSPDVRLRLWVALRGLELLRRRSVPDPLAAR